MLWRRNLYWIALCFVASVISLLEQLLRQLCTSAQPLAQTRSRLCNGKQMVWWGRHRNQNLAPFVTADNENTGLVIVVPKNSLGL